MPEARDKHLKVLFSLSENFGFNRRTGDHFMFSREGLNQKTKKNISISKAFAET